ncbi:mitochondrial import inner membrane translocase subunit tim21 [Echria macrotheca]|uniref:Mitochondrial import inner membrane translocase subunit Tim21 n=1 Tax=Echria macrotheca TaxID=438768 RepID=A0AAJ0B8H4_9PEZI|nr:mitochondrial import inner membrane translocase subunit tim21 [Echria macrotheca]
MMNRISAPARHLHSSPTTTAKRIARPLLFYQQLSPAAHRRYATQQSRKAVTPFNDDGRVPWTHLSMGEKTGRAAQQTFNFGMVIVGLVLTGGVGYVLYQEVFSPDSKTAYFNRAVDRIKKDPRCLEVLGDAKKITAYGEETFNKWRRARPIASTLTKDGQGNEHLMIHFNVQGPKGGGVVQMHLIRRNGREDFEYKYFFVDVRGHPRIYLENADASLAAKKGDQKGFKMFGIKWT